MQEIWKDIDGYNGRYKVSNLGRVKSFARSYKTNDGRLLSATSTRGYMYVCLTAKNGKKKSEPLHRLVAKAFVPNPNNYKEINHRDEDKRNNTATNLEWCTREYNMSYGTARVRQGISMGNPVEQLIDGDIVIATYASAEIASRLLNIDSSSIHKCCVNKRVYAGGYMWRYLNSSGHISQKYATTSLPESHES